MGTFHFSIGDSDGIFLSDYSSDQIHSHQQIKHLQTHTQSKNEFESEEISSWVWSVSLDVYTLAAGMFSFLSVSQY